MAAVSDREAKARPRQIAALEMREDGKTFGQIGEEFGVSAARARQIVERAKELRDLPQEDDAKLRARWATIIGPMKAALRAEIE